MPRWTKPSEGMPERVCVGDRVAIIVRERLFEGQPLFNRLVLLEATEDGWRSIEAVYSGYSIGDGVLWSMERDICQIADLVS